MRILKILMISVISILSFPITAQTVWSGVTERISLSSEGEQGNNGSVDSSISADGRFVAFSSEANNLVLGDTYGMQDIFVHDRQTGQTTRVSVSSDGEQGNANSIRPSLSADGRFVAFSSYANNLVPGDTNGEFDFFVHDRQTGETTRVSVSSDGEQANRESQKGEISADGRFVAFSTIANNLVPNDTNDREDVFVHDRQTGETTRVSMSSGGEQGNSGSSVPSISADGRFVAFSSEANNLVPGDTNGREDVFVHDRQTGETTRVSVSSDGGQGNRLSESGNSSISADGRFVAFSSYANNLVPGDTNGFDDVFVHDCQTGQTTRVSVNSGGEQGNSRSIFRSISTNGHFVAFSSFADNLVPGDTNILIDGFVHDRQTGETTRVSVSSDGGQGNDYSGCNSISADGHFVTFESGADNLVVGDTNNASDVFVHDRFPDLLYAPVTPCRISDSRTYIAPWAQGQYRGPFSVGQEICYSNYGPGSTIGPQGGNQNGCPSTVGEPGAFQVVVTAVPVWGSGHIRLYPANVPRPMASVLSWSANAGNISNGVSADSYYNTGPGGDDKFCIYIGGPASGGQVYIIMDVMGYYIPAP